MLGSAPLVAFVPATDLDRARAFYAGVLGLPAEEANPFALVFRAGPTMLRVSKVDEFTPYPFTVLGWSVVDIRDSAKRLAEAGVEAVRYPGMPQDEQGIWTTPDGAAILWFTDPDGNTLSLTQFTP